MLRNGALLLTGATLPVANWDALLASEPSPKDVARGAMITDLHFADKPPAGSRHYRETTTTLWRPDELG